MAQHVFTGKTVLISGAGRGLGKQAALCFAQAGARMVLNDFDAATLEQTLAELKNGGFEACGIAGDIAKEETSAKLVELTVETFGGLHIAVNNAGIAQEQVRLHQIDSGEAERVVAIDLMGVFYAMKHQIPLMLKTLEAEGSQANVLNVASAAGVMGSPMLSMYAAAKHGVVGLTRSAALEYGAKGIRINALCPAFARTNMVTDMLDTSKHGPEMAEARLVSNNPMRRLGEIDEVVQAMLWACSGENSFFNGQALSIDGGLRSF